MENEMDTNLDGAWKTDGKKEIEGDWFEVSKGVEFKVRRFGGRNALNVKETYSKNKRKREETDEETARSFIKACITDWKGVKANGEDLPFTEDNAVDVLVALPDLTDHLFELAKNMDNFKVEMGND